MGGAVRDVDDPVQAWQGGTSTLARTPTRSALRPTPTPRRIQPSEASARLAAHVAEGVGLVTTKQKVVNRPAAFEQPVDRFELPENRDGRQLPVDLGQVTAEDPDGDVLTYDVGQRPAGVVLHSLPAAPALRCTRARAGHRPASSLVHIIHGRAPQCYEQQRLQVFCWPSSKRAR